MDKAILTRVDREREAVAALYPDALNNSTITHGLVMIHHGSQPDAAWRAVAVSLAIENESLRKMMLRYAALVPGPSLVPAQCVPQEPKA